MRERRRNKRSVMKARNNVPDANSMPGSVPAAFFIPPTTPTGESMSQVRIIVAMSLVAIASGAVSAGIVVSITDAGGNTQSQDIPVATFPTPDAQGNFTVEADFGGVGSGSFTGSVQSIDNTRAPIGDSVSYSGTASNLQPMPVSVSVAFA